MWNLLVESENIKVGDLILVELESGETIKMKFIKSSDKFVYLKNYHNEIVRFFADSLESRFGSGLIVGRA